MLELLIILLIFSSIISIYIFVADFGSVPNGELRYDEIKGYYREFHKKNKK